jgi:hypothetical protein
LVFFKDEFIWLCSPYWLGIEEMILWNVNSNGLKQAEVCGFKDNRIKIKIALIFYFLD